MHLLTISYCYLIGYHSMSEHQGDSFLVGDLYVDQARSGWTPRDGVSMDDEYVLPT